VVTLQRKQKMKYRKLGNTGFDVSELGFGTWQIGGERWEAGSYFDNVKMLRKALKLGVNIFDAAVVYGQYGDEKGVLQSRSQELLGEAFENDRDKVIYCIKFGQFDEFSHRSDFSPDRIVDQFKQSLRRLKTDYIDIALIHAPSLSKVRDEKAIRVLQTLRSMGLVKAIGYGFENEPEHVRVAMYQDIDVLMLQYNLLDDQCGSVIDELEERGIGTLVGGPFKRGYLTGDYSTIKHLEDEKDDYWKLNLRRNRGKVEQILERVNEEKAKAGSAESLRVNALDFVLSKPVSSAVVGHRSIFEVQQNAKVIEGRKG